jgi:hypothetical protein
VSTPGTQEISDWLETLGLRQYAPRFAENDTFAILRDLTDQDLKELGVASLGHRRELLRAIAEFHGVEKRPPKPSPPVARQDIMWTAAPISSGREPKRGAGPETEEE